MNTFSSVGSITLGVSLTLALGGCANMLTLTHGDPHERQIANAAKSDGELCELIATKGLAPSQIRGEWWMEIHHRNIDCSAYMPMIAAQPQSRVPDQSLSSLGLAIMQMSRQPVYNPINQYQHWYGVQQLAPKPYMPVGSMVPQMGYPSPYTTLR